MIKIKYFSKISGGLLSFFLVFGAIEPVKAARSVILNYGPLQEEISVEELSALAREGKVSRSLRAYLRMANQDPEDLQKLLVKPVKVNPLTLYKFLNRIPGELLLDEVSNIIRTPSKRASRQSLRAALVGSALEDREIQLIEVLENYPTEDVYVEADRLVAAYNRINGIVGKLGIRGNFGDNQ